MLWSAPRIFWRIWAPIEEKASSSAVFHGTEHMLENSRAKMEKKHIDMIVANNLRQEGAGFGTDTNVVTLLTKEETLELPILSKEEVADRLLTFILEKQGKKA